MYKIKLNYAIIIIYIIVFFDCNGVSMITPILPKISEQFNSSSLIHGITFVSYSVTQFFSIFYI